MVVNVGGKNTANIQPNMKDPGHAGTEYDTIYFDKNKADHAEYTFTPTADEGNTLKVRVHDPLHNTHLGSPLNTHRNIPEKGMGVNTNAGSGENSPYFSTLPDVTLTVKANEEEAYNAFSYAQLQGWTANDQYSTLTASNWADLDAVRNVTLVNALYMGDQDQHSTVDLKLDAEPIRDDVTLTARFREEGTEI